MLELFALMMKECLFFLGYITGKSEFPKQLARSEEEALIARMLAGDEAARETLITHNLRLVSHIARKYTVPGYDADDLMDMQALLRKMQQMKGGSKLVEQLVAEWKIKYKNRPAMMDELRKL